MNRITRALRQAVIAASKSHRPAPPGSKPMPRMLGCAIAVYFAAGLLVLLAGITAALILAPSMSNWPASCQTVTITAGDIPNCHP